MKNYLRYQDDFLTSNPESIAVSKVHEFKEGLGLKCTIVEGR
jgi:hypothetical protein